MAYLLQYRATKNDEFRGRISACLRKIAFDVYNEPSTTAGYRSRRNLAEKVLMDPSDPFVLSPFVWEAACNPTVTSTLAEDGSSPQPDGDFEYIIAAAWDSVVNQQKW